MTVQAQCYCNHFLGKCRVLKGEQRRPLRQSFCRALQYSFLSLLVNDNNTTWQVKLGRARRKLRQSFGASYRSCRGWLCSPWQRCSNRQYQPSWAASWAQGRTRCQYHGGQGWDAPAQSRSDQSPCRARCGAFRSCYPNNLSWRGQWTAWPGWWHHGWRWPPLWSTSHPDPHDRCSHQWQQRPVNQTKGQ